MAECKCNELLELHGVEGENYVREHLVEIVVDVINWRTLYQCPITKRLWRDYHPHPGYHGGGPVHFFQITIEQAMKDFDWNG